MKTTRRHLNQHSGAYASPAIHRNDSPPPSTKMAIGKDVGPVLYVFRLNDDTIKIGWTTRIYSRKHEFRLRNWEQVLAIWPGTREDEAEVLARFQPYIDHGREYFRPNGEILAFVNEIRTNYGLSTLEPWF